MFHKGDQKCGALGLVVAILLGLILIVLVFKVGMMAGGKGSGMFSHRAGMYRNVSIEDFEAKAELMGMTVEEFRAYLAEQKK